MPTAKLPRVGWRETKPRRVDRPGLVYAQLKWTPQSLAEGKGLETLGWTTPEAASLAAEQKAFALEAERRGFHQPNASPPAPSAPSIAVLIGEYANDLEARGVGVEGYRANVVNRSAYLTRHLGRILVDKLTLRDLQGYVSTRRRELGGRALTNRKRPLEKGEQLGREPRRVTVQDELRLLRRILNTTRGWGLHGAAFPGMPAFKDWPNDATPARKLTPAEHRALVETAAIDRPGLARLMEFMGWCPRRPVAIFDIRREDCARVLAGHDGIDLLFVRRDKGGRDLGWSPLLPEARAALLAHLADTIGPPGEVVWRPAIAAAYDARSLRSVLTYLSTKAGIPRVTPYDLRKLATVRAYRACKRSLKSTCRFTGHADTQVLVRHYLHDEEDVVLAAVRGDLSDSADTDSDTARDTRR